ncbi:MAG TPA: hypothetical protein VEQ59_10525, partial [Polyangiaceae bacterium]|nr:hypothetical protein [Polyangiaceae bacterium]
LRAACLISCLSATAHADPAAPTNIPEPRTNPAIVDDEANSAAASELPLPYTPWQGTGLSPPRTNDASDAEQPLPLARPRQLPRRPFELSAALSVFLPSCGTGSVDDRGCLTVAAGSGVDLAFTYRIAPFFAFGAEAAFSGFGGGAAGPLSRASGDARFFGVVGRVYFADDGVWDPYLALTVGAGALALRAAETSDASEATKGMGARVAGGIDYVLGSHVRIGPAASFAHWVAWSEASCAGGVCRDEPALYGKLLGFATLGIRLTASVGEVL